MMTLGILPGFVPELENSIGASSVGKGRSVASSRGSVPGLYFSAKLEDDLWQDIRALRYPKNLV